MTAICDRRKYSDPLCEYRAKIPRRSGSHLKSSVNRSSNVARRSRFPLLTSSAPMPPNDLSGLNNRKAMCFPSGDQATNEGASEEIGRASCREKCTSRAWPEHEKRKEHK